MLKILITIPLFLFGVVLANAQQTTVSPARAAGKDDTVQIKKYIDTANSYLNKVYGNKTILDSGYTYCKLALTESEKIHNELYRYKSIRITAYYYDLSGDDTKAIPLQKQYIDFCHQRKDFYEEANGWYYLGYYYTKDLNQVHFCFQQAQDIFNKLGHKDKAIESLKCWGDQLLGAEKLDSAESVLQEVIREYKAIGYDQLQSTYYLLATVSRNKGDFDDELAYRLEVVKYVESTKNNQSAGLYYYDLASCYDKFHKYDQSIFYFEKSIAVDGPNSYMCMGSIVNDYLHMNKPHEALIFLKAYIRKYPPATNGNQGVIDNGLCDIYTQLKQYGLAEKFLLKSFAIRKVQFTYSKIQTLTLETSYVLGCEKLINLFILNHQIKEAQRYLAAIPADYSNGIAPQNMIGLELTRFKVDSASGNYFSALKHYQNYKKVDDSIYSVKKTRAVEEIEAKYQTEKKEHTINLLESQQRVQGMITQKAIAQRNVTLAAIAIALLLAGAAFYAYRRKKLSNLLINKKNHQLQVLLTEKEWLLKEVHHRVKNNLHTVICLLESQAAYLENDALKAVESSQHRIFAMSLVHQRLYQSDDIQTVDIAVYLSEFIIYLKESFGSPANIIFRQQIETIRLDVSQAIPLALIINEAVTNAMKYAFPENRHGLINIALTSEEDAIRLSVEDDGIGMPESVQAGKLTSLGLDLIKGLTDDLKGKVQFLVRKGTSVIVSFNKGPFSQMAATG